MRSSKSLTFELVKRSLFGKIVVPNGLLHECVQIASLNKVLLHFLRNVECQSHVVNELLEREERRFKMVLDGLEEVVNALDGLNYVLVKFRRPVLYVPSDIDFVIDTDSIPIAITRLRRLGFKPVLIEPYCITLIRGSIIVDLYAHLSLGGSLIYVSGDALSRYAKYVEVNGVKAKALLEQAEAIVIAAHAVLKEGIYTLNDYATTKAWLDYKALEIAEELKCKDVVEIALLINEVVDNGLLALPFKMPLTTWLLNWAKKAIRDSTTRASILKLLNRLMNKDVLFKALWRYRRITY